MPSTTRVIFRMDKHGKCREVTAVLPDEASGNSMMVCYGHIGQHGSCSYAWYHRTRPATPVEYAPLLAELQGIYAPEFTLVVRTRINRKG